MSAKRDNAKVIGVGVAACAACCAGPIIGALTAIGVGTAAGVALFGAMALAVGVLAVAAVVWRRRRQRVDACATGVRPGPVPVELSNARLRP